MVALALKKMKMSLSVLIVAWGSIRKVGFVYKISDFKVDVRFRKDINDLTSSPI